jgi:hypothetical protein
VDGTRALVGEEKGSLWAAPGAGAVARSSSSARRVCVPAAEIPLDGGDADFEFRGGMAGMPALDEIQDLFETSERDLDGA